MINSVSQISFKSKYKFVSKKALDNFVHQKELESLRNIAEGKDRFSMVKRVSDCGTDSVYINKNRLAYTNNAGSCVVYGITLPKTACGFLGHYNKYPTEIFDMIKNRLDGDRGFIIGGNADCEDIFYKTALEVFEKNNIKTTVFYGQSGLAPTTDVLFDRQNDTIYIAPSKVINSVDNLKSYYQTIKVANGDEVYIRNRKINL